MTSILRRCLCEPRHLMSIVCMAYRNNVCVQVDWWLGWVEGVASQEQRLSLPPPSICQAPHTHITHHAGLHTTLVCTPSSYPMEKCTCESTSQSASLSLCLVACKHARMQVYRYKQKQIKVQPRTYRTCSMHRTLLNVCVTPLRRRVEGGKVPHARKKERQWPYSMWLIQKRSEARHVWRLTSTTTSPTYTTYPSHMPIGMATP